MNYLIIWYSTICVYSRGPTGRLAAARAKMYLIPVRRFHLGARGVCSSMAASLVEAIVLENSNWLTNPR